MLADALYEADAVRVSGIDGFPGYAKHVVQMPVFDLSDAAGFGSVYSKQDRGTIEHLQFAHLV